MFISSGAIAIGHRFRRNTQFSAERVTPKLQADGATVEASFSTEYAALHPIIKDRASLVLVSGAYKAGMIYAINPATEDFITSAFTRASIGTRFNPSGVIVTEVANIPRVDYIPATSTVKGYLLERASTNLMLNSATATTQSYTVTAQSYTLSFYGTGTIALSGTFTGNLVGTGTARVSLTFTPTAGTLTQTVTGSCTNGQLETAGITSYIPTTATAVTRVIDASTITRAITTIMEQFNGVKTALVYSGGNKTTFTSGVKGATVVEAAPASYAMKEGLTRTVAIFDTALTDGEAIDITT